MYYKEGWHDWEKISNLIQVGHQGEGEKAFQLCRLWILWVSSQYQPYQNEHIDYADVQWCSLADAIKVETQGRNSSRASCSHIC